MDRERSQIDRLDLNLPELLRFDHIAWFEDGALRMLDRRVYPMIRRYETCRSVDDVVQAIRNMVTQSGGPLLAVQMGMALAAHEVRDETSVRQIAHLESSAVRLQQSRPTTSREMGRLVTQSLAVGKAALMAGRNVVEAIKSDAIAEANRRYASIQKIAVHLVKSFPASGTIMTQCFAETIVGMMCSEAGKQAKNVRFICPETRPYLQGARLTASVIADSGFPVYLITDNMPAAILKREDVDLFTSAADVITGDGHVVNKVGTFQIALAANYYDIPYYVTGEISAHHADITSIHIEERDKNEVLTFLGTRIAKPAVDAFYPAFDITPPELVSGIVTPLGIIDPRTGLTT